MANGQMGKKISEETKQYALKLLAKGNTVSQVQKRLNLSQSVLRNWMREHQATKQESQSNGRN